MGYEIDGNRMLVHKCRKEYSNADWHRYAYGYKHAAIIIIEDLLSNSTRKLDDELIFPLLYLVRHFSELLLKQIIAYYCELEEQRIQISNKHSLFTLWEKAKPIGKEIIFSRLITTPEKFGSAMTEDDFQTIESIIIQLEEYDKTATAFKYPIDTKGIISLSNDFEVELNSLKLKIHELFSALDHISFSINLVKAK